MYPAEAPSGCVENDTRPEPVPVIVKAALSAKVPVAIRLEDTTVARSW
jgi:hypothetical protein